MPLLVVALGEAETPQLTLAEWDALGACDIVLFERAGHPLAQRLKEEGVTVEVLDDEPSPAAERCALVVEPTSRRLVELAKGGARILIGSAVCPDDLTAAHGAYIARRAEASFGGLAALMARLRGPDGCPWDAKQTHESLQKHLLEEAEEVIEAIEAGTTGSELEDELGDVLLQVVFHAQLAADDGRFDVQGVAEAIQAKLIRRHPHVFGDAEVADADEVIRNWHAIKAAEKAGTDPAFALEDPRP